MINVPLLILFTEYSFSKSCAFFMMSKCCKRVASVCACALPEWIILGVCSVIFGLSLKSLLITLFEGFFAIRRLRLINDFRSFLTTIIINFSRVTQSAARSVCRADDNVGFLPVWLSLQVFPFMPFSNACNPSPPDLSSQVMPLLFVFLSLNYGGTLSILTHKWNIWLFIF